MRMIKIEITEDELGSLIIMHQAVSDIIKNRENITIKNVQKIISKAENELKK